MLKTNEKNLVKIAVEGKVAPALVWPNEVGHDGKIYNVPACGGITYNVLVGDKASGWVSDHIEPGVSALVDAEKRSGKINLAFNFLACTGNEVIVLSGAAKGKKGMVLGHHGGVEHVMLDFPTSVLNKLSNSDTFQIRAFGQGLQLNDFPNIRLLSLDPKLLAKMKLKIKNNQLEVPIAASVPGKLMGSGLGSANTYSGDYDIMTADQKVIKKLGLDKLKLGDLVAIEDMDANNGWCYRKGAIMIGVIIHGDSHLAGHGPGVHTLMSSANGEIVTKIDKQANVGRYLGMGRFRK